METQGTSAMLTIIICAYNMEEYILPCLQSIASQSSPAPRAARVLAIDDGSTDRTAGAMAAFAKEHPQWMETHTVSHRGLGAARNFGLGLVQTPYCTFLDADDWLPPEYLASFQQCLANAGDADILFTLPTCYDERNGTYSHWYDHDVITEKLAAHAQPFTVQEAPELLAMQTSACSKIFSTPFLRDIGFAFPEQVLWEDVYPHYLAVIRARACLAMPASGFVNRRFRRNQITRTRTDHVLDMMPQFERSLNLLENQQWSEYHWACFLQRLVAFSRWMFDLSTPAALGRLAKQAHALFGRVPIARWQYYRRLSPLSTRKERLLIGLMRSPVYGIFARAYYAQRTRKAEED